MEMRARIITDDIDKITVKQKDLRKAITMMETESNECMQLAEKKKELSFVIKKKSKQTNKKLATLQKEIAELEMKKKKIIWFISDKALVLNYFFHHQFVFCSACLLPHFLK